MEKQFKHIYGPVSSWRLGRSLGIDPVCSHGKTICSFDCIYCQADRTKVLTARRSVYVSTEEITGELKSFPPAEIDYVTFSGSGEPTLALNLGELIREARGIRKAKIAVITNASLIDKKDVQEDLLLADFVFLKIDAHSKDIFRKINRPANGINYGTILKGIKEFSASYKGRLAIQMMFVSENKPYAKEMARLARTLKVKEIQINTPLRPSAAKFISMKDMIVIKKFFRGMNVVSVYDIRRKMDA